MRMAPCNQEMKRRYAPLDGASETEGRLDPRQGGFPRRERPWAAVIDKRPAAEASWVRRKAIINGRKLRRAFSDLFLSFTKETAACPRKRSRADGMCARSPRACAVSPPFVPADYAAPGKVANKRARIRAFFFCFSEKNFPPPLALKIKT